jgi:uncharacterized protein HemY
VQLKPEHRNHWSNLGVALCRTGEWQAAALALEKADRMESGADHYHRFFLAMAYWHLGEKDKARQAYEQAAEWMNENQPNNDELRRFRAEAAELLNIQDDKKPK